jgi:hypothetical protein
VLVVLGRSVQLNQSQDRIRLFLQLPPLAGVKVVGTQVRFIVLHLVVLVAVLLMQPHLLEAEQQVKAMRVVMVTATMLRVVAELGR